MATKTVKVHVETECPKCEGKGYIQEPGVGLYGLHSCPVCKGDQKLKSETTKTVETD